MMIIIIIIPFFIISVLRAGYCSRYCDSLRSGRSGDLSPMEERSAPSRQALGLTQPRIQWEPGHFLGGKATGAWR